MVRLIAETGNLHKDHHIGDVISAEKVWLCAEFVGLISVPEPGDVVEIIFGEAIVKPSVSDGISCDL
jgi:hypothetical protein